VEKASKRMIWLRISIVINYWTECLTQSSKSNSKRLGNKPAGLETGWRTANKW